MARRRLSNIEFEKGLTRARTKLTERHRYGFDVEESLVPLGEKGGTCDEVITVVREMAA